jgi:hypothetical protein
MAQGTALPIKRKCVQNSWRIFPILLWTLSLLLGRWEEVFRRSPSPLIGPASLVHSLPANLYLSGTVDNGALGRDLGEVTATTMMHDFVLNLRSLPHH